MTRYKDESLHIINFITKNPDHINSMISSLRYLKIDIHSKCSFWVWHKQLKYLISYGTLSTSPWIVSRKDRHVFANRIVYNTPEILFIRKKHVPLCKNVIFHRKAYILGLYVSILSLHYLCVISILSRWLLKVFFLVKLLTRLRWDMVRYHLCINKRNVENLLTIV